MKKFFKKTDNEEKSMITDPSTTKKKRCISVGSIINYSIAIDFVAIFVTSLIVLGCIGTVQHDLVHNFNYNETQHDHLCFMFATCGPHKPGQNHCDFQPEYSARTCDGSMVGYALIALMSVGFVISLVVKAVLSHDLNWTLYIEVPVLVFCILVEFALSVMISIGNLTTCYSIQHFYGSGNCSLSFPNTNPGSEFYHATRADVARNSAWFVFLFLFVALIVYFIRLFIFIKRKRKLIIQETIDKESFKEGEESEPKPI